MTLLRLYQALEYYLALPENKELAKNLLTEMEWEVLRDVKRILSVRQ